MSLPAPEQNLSSGPVEAGSLSPEGQQVSEALEEPPHVRDVEVDVVREVGANVGVRAHQGAVEGGPADADHHGDQTEQQQDEAGISADLICERDVDKTRR